MPDLTPIFPYIIPFLLVLFRLTGLFVFVPVFSNTSIPGNVKVLLALAMAVCVWPVASQASTALPPADIISLVLAVMAELSVGLLIGILVSMVFMGIMLGAHLISQQMGLSLGAVYDPMFDEQSTVIEQVAFWLTLVIFFAVGGERQLIAALVESYRTIPLGHGLSPEYMLQVVLGSIESAFHIAVRVGTPALVAFFLGTLASGFIAKSMPQINMSTIGLGMNLLIGFGMILVSLVAWAMLGQEAWQGMFTVLARALGG